MAQVFNLPLTTLKAGASQQFSFAIPAGASEAFVNIDRTAGNSPLNNDATALVTVKVELSFDGGATFQNQGSIQVTGGQVVDQDGVTIQTSSWIDVQVTQPGATNIRVTVSSNNRVTVSGTATIN